MWRKRKDILLGIAGAVVFIAYFAAMIAFAGMMFVIGAWVGCLFVGC